MQTKLDLTAVNAHYTGLLKQAGWTQQDGGDAGSLAWSAWAFTDADGQPWTGLFTILARPDRQQELLLTLRIEAANSGTGAPWSGTGWLTTGR